MEQTEGAPQAPLFCRLKGTDLPHRDSLTAIASGARDFLETVWPDWQRQMSPEPHETATTTLSYSTCGRSSTFVRKVLDNLGMPAEVRHGWFRSTSSEPEARHAWVACGPWLVDVTGDQFGADPVIVTSHSDGRYRSDIDAAHPEFQQRRVQATAEIWERWLQSPIRAKLVADLGMRRQ